MSIFPYEASDPSRGLPNLGLIVLQTDVTIERDFRRMFAIDEANLFFTRIRSEPTVTPDTLATMKDVLPGAVSLFPEAQNFDAVGYGCTSGTAVIGADKISTLVQQGCHTRNVTQPLSALVAACKRRNIKRLAFLSPYLESVSDVIRRRLRQQGIETPIFGSFGEENDARVATISAKSISQAAHTLMEGHSCDGLFLSCTNLNTLDVLEPLGKALGVPVLSSNQVLGEHMRELAFASSGER